MYVVTEAFLSVRLIASLFLYHLIIVGGDFDVVVVITMEEGRREDQDVLCKDEMLILLTKERFITKLFIDIE